MGERGSHAPGTFSWTDLGARDAVGAKAFYSGLFGWETQDTEGPDAGTYTMCLLGGKPVAALYARSDDAKMPPNWLSYVTVSSVNDAAARARELGATVAMEPFDVADSGRMALIADPTGAFVGLWEPRSHAGAGLVNASGAMTWNELVTREPEPAARFYESLLGWRTDSVEGADGYLVIENDGRMNGGIRRITDDEPAGMPAHWTVYFAVEDAEAAVAKAKELGGKALLEPVTLPSGRVATLADPQGATFAVFQGDLDD
jgi:predicted enzyme related to lactoylglutathione lyase